MTPLSQTLEHITKCGDSTVEATQLDPKAQKWLLQRFSGCVSFAEPMSKHTWLRVGGPADALVRPENLNQLIELITWSWKNAVPCMTIGDGSNLLVRDRGIRGIVVSLSACLNSLEADRGHDFWSLKAQAGVRMQRLCRFAIEQGLEGLNFAVGIPGTVGGAVRMNAGTGIGCVADVLDRIEVLLPNGQINQIERKELDFGYRQLAWDQCSHPGLYEKAVILSGRFRLNPNDPGRLKTEAQEILNARKMSQPLGQASAGCFFKNPTRGTSAGELIDRAGLKGRSMGGAEISTKHANFIINRSQATAEDILALMRLVQETVNSKFNIILEPEVKIVGQ